MDWETFIRGCNRDFWLVASEQERVGSQVEAEKRACPALRTAWGDDPPVTVAYAIAGSYLQVTSDHLEGLTRVIYADLDELAVAPFALARAVVEAAAIAGWLTEPLDMDSRQAAIVRGSRVLTLTLESEAERQNQSIRITGKAASPDSVAASVILATEGDPYFPLKRNRDGVAIRVGEEPVPKRGELQARLMPHGRYGYFVLSSVSHGLAFAALGQVAAAMMQAPWAQLSRQTTVVAALTAMGEAAVRLGRLKGLDVSNLERAVDIVNEIHTKHMDQLGIQHPGSGLA